MEILFLTPLVKFTHLFATWADREKRGKNIYRQTFPLNFSGKMIRNLRIMGRLLDPDPPANVEKAANNMHLRPSLISVADPKLLIRIP